jgi:thiamine kinase
MKTPMHLPDAVLKAIGGEPSLMAPLGRGATNRLWQLERGQQAWVWRQFSTAPGVDRAREAALMQAAASYPWMPPVAVWHEQGMLMPWLAGEHLSTLTAEQRAVLLEFCLGLWAQPRQQFSQWNYVELVTMYANLAGSAHSDLAERLRQEAAQWPQAEPCWVHHDLHAGNLLWHDTGCWVLDWEFAGLGNPWLDAVSLDRWVHWQPEEWARLEPYLAPWSWRDAQAYADWLSGLETLWYAALGADGAFGSASLR